MNVSLSFFLGVSSLNTGAVVVCEKIDDVDDGMVLLQRRGFQIDDGNVS